MKKLYLTIALILFTTIIAIFGGLVGSDSYHYVKNQQTLNKSIAINKAAFKDYEDLEFFNDLTFYINYDLADKNDAVAQFKNKGIYLDYQLFKSPYPYRDYVILHEYSHYLIKKYNISNDLINTSPDLVGGERLNLENEMLTDYLATILYTAKNGKDYDLPLTYLSKENLKSLENNKDLNDYICSLDILDFKKNYSESPLNKAFWIVLNFLHKKYVKSIDK